jgi:hypothetical protein
MNLNLRALKIAPTLKSARECADAAANEQHTILHKRGRLITHEEFNGL